MTALGNVRDASLEHGEIGECAEQQSVSLVRLPHALDVGIGRVLDEPPDFQRSMAAQVLCSLSEAEGDLVAAREHLLNALAARGLTPDETRLVLDRIRALDARLSAGPQ